MLRRNYFVSLHHPYLTLMHMKYSIKYLILTGWLILTSLMQGYAQIRTGAEQTECYFPLIEGKG